MRPLFTLTYFVAILLLSFNALAKEQKTPFKVGILMFDNVQIIDFAAPYEVFGQARFEVHTVSVDGKPVTTAMGLNVSPDHSFTSLPQVDAILVPGGNVHKVSKNPDVLNWLKAQHGKVGNILSVCTGSDIIAESGLLDGLSATTFHRNLDNLAQDYPQIKVVDDQRFVDNGNIITSAGLSSGIDAALYLVGKIKGVEAAKTIAMHIEYDWQPEKGFVRGIMADKHYPNNKYQWADGTSFSNAISYGDKNHWYRSYGVVTSSKVNELQDIYRQAIAADKTWIAAKDHNSNELIWHKTISEQQWQLAFKVEQDAQGNAVKLVNTLKALTPKSGQTRHSK